MKLTLEQLASELETEHRANGAAFPRRAAFVDALDARGTDARTKQFKHYDRIIQWMIANWDADLQLQPKCPARTDNGKCTPFATDGTHCEYCGRVL